MQLYWVSASHTGRYARLTSLGLYAQAVQSVRPVESTEANSILGQHLYQLTASAPSRYLHCPLSSKDSGSAFA
jgi:hypothetical protein